MKILIASANSYPAAPTGPVYIAGALRQCGHEVRIYDSLLDPELRELQDELSTYQPDVVGVSIRLVHGDIQDRTVPFGTRYIDLRPRIKQLTDTIKEQSMAHIILGGPGFSYYAHDWLEYLDLHCGICGEAEEIFPQYLQAVVEGADPRALAGCAFRDQHGCLVNPPHRPMNLNHQGLPGYDLLAWERYAVHNITPAVFTKRGCAFDCSFCPYSKLEGKQYRLKSPQRVLNEIHHTLAYTASKRILICDNSFNAPRRHAEALCRAFREDRLEWGSGDLKPLGLNDEFCGLMKDSGCYYLNLSIESGSDSMLANMRRGYQAKNVRQSIEALSRAGIPFGASLLLGGPGETPDTIAETLDLMSTYSFPLGVWVTIGVYMWTELQDITREARRSGYLGMDQSLFDGPVYLSPHISRTDLDKLVDYLHRLPGYTVQVNRSDRISVSNPQL
jgi:radical SAM superfamily enzyme YgiQ (UPF0313 family)